MDYEKISFRPGVKCWHCKELVEDDERRPVFYEKDAAHKVCEFCVSEMENGGEVIRCDGCGDLFMSKMLRAEKVCGETFAPCPHCGCDVVTGWSREKYLEQYGEDAK